MESISSRSRAAFVTFYSFKGGVGRTMALINVACILAARGRRVLMIDFDLEAPGLTLFQQRTSQKKAKSATRQAGLVELIHDFLSNSKTSPLADEENKASFRDHYVVKSLPIPETLKHLEGGYLDLMPCGRLNRTYEQRLYDIKFDKLYEEGVGQPLFKHFKNVIIDSNLYDYVLVDSRTGLSDEGSICTRDLADHLVIIMGLNYQNVEGTVRVLNQLKESNWKGGRTLFVASPVPEFYEELREERMQSARRAINKTGFKADLKLHIPYHPRLALDEEPFVYNWSNTNLFSAYERIQREILLITEGSPQTWGQLAIEAVNRKEFNEALRLLRNLSVESPEAAAASLSILTGSLIDKNLALRPYADQLFKLWSTVSADEVAIRQRHAEFFRMQGEYDRAIKELNHALEITLRHRDDRRVNSVRYQLGDLLYDMDRYEEALKEYQKVYESAQEMGDRHYVHGAQFAIGQMRLREGDYESALQAFKTGLKSQEEIGDRHNAAIDRAGIAIVHRIRGEYQKASQLFEDALEFQRSVNDRPNIASTLTHIGRMYEAQGKYELALKSYEEALKINKELGNQLSIAISLGDIGKVKTIIGDTADGLSYMETSIKYIQEIGVRGELAARRLFYSESLMHIKEPVVALNYLDKYWADIQQFGTALVKAESHVIRARMKAALGDATGAAEDARVAAEFYHKNNVHTALSKEAEELANSVPADQALT